MQPSPAYEPYYQETRINFEVCDGIMQVLEDEDNDTLSFDQIVQQVGLCCAIFFLFAQRLMW